MRWLELQQLPSNGWGQTLGPGEESLSAAVPQELPGTVPDEEKGGRKKQVVGLGGRGGHIPKALMISGLGRS